MPFSIRPYRRFPVQCSVTYQVGNFEGHGNVRNISLRGWQFSGNLPLRIRGVCSLTVNLQNAEAIYAATGIVRWVRGEEYGVETLMIEEESREEVEEYVWDQVRYQA